MKPGDKVWAISYDEDGHVIEQPNPYVLVASVNQHMICFPVSNNCRWEINEVLSYCRTATWTDGEAPLCVFHESCVYLTEDQADTAIEEISNERRSMYGEEV